ncbi:MAG: RHS repeat-associated core domain-containing protein, partial [Bacteriovorax sp.]|nr:RHS repeat-associated core domain-containing protein [Bacteriovorax sp.]
MLNFNSVIQGASTGITPMNGIPGGTIADPNTPIAPIIPDPTNPTDVAVYDNQDRLVRYKNHVYSYNANGDLLSKSVEIPDDIDPGTFNLVTTNYVYDIFGNLNQFGNITYQIDPLQRRSAKLVNGVVVKKYIYNPEGQLIGELDAAGNLQKTFIYASKAHVPDYYVDSNNNHFKLIVDQLGSVRLVINATPGAIVQQMNHDEFGKATMDTSPGLQPFGFAGGLYDSDTKLVRFGLRDFDSEIGRWNSKDVIRFSAGDSNLYGYTF